MLLPATVSQQNTGGRSVNNHTVHVNIAYAYKDEQLCQGTAGVVIGFGAGQTQTGQEVSGVVQGYCWASLVEHGDFKR